jgi:hypothetical protein
MGFKTFRAMKSITFVFWCPLTQIFQKNSKIKNWTGLINLNLW